MHWAEKEVPSVELCKRLKELGFPQTPDGYYWAKYAPTIKYKLYFRTEKDFFYFYNGQFWTILTDPIETIKAPTYREIDEWLPPYWKNWYPEFPCPIAIALENFIKKEYTPTNNKIDTHAKLLIFLRETGYIIFKQGDKDNAQPR